MENYIAGFPKARKRAEALLGQLTLKEKIGQLVQVSGSSGRISDQMRRKVSQGGIGSIINEVDPEKVTELQRIAREDSPHGIPLLIGRDVIHGFKTVLPIPLGLAATWNELLVEQGARVAAVEASHQGVNWTFSPMLDVSRDPRWGRIAESFGEDPMLTARMACAMVRGYQDDSEHRLLSCLKHFVGYGASESGRDYNTANIPETELRNVYLPPFYAAIQAGALSVMTSFSDLNGVPATANAWLLRDVLRSEWQFKGFVVSDWESITQLTVHGVAEDVGQAALKAALAGVNMDMVSGAYENHLESLISGGLIEQSDVEELACEILTAKFQLGLFDSTPHTFVPAPNLDVSRRVAKQLAMESVVLLKNDRGLLPITDARHETIGLVGPLADQPSEQLGTWVFDGEVADSVSVKQALASRIGDRLKYAPGLLTSRDCSDARFDEALEVARSSDLVVVVLGEEAILSGEAHCRADITLPGAQCELLQRLRQSGKPLLVVIMAGRPLVIGSVVEAADAILYAWHPGTFAGPALADVIFGDVSPSGKLPVTIPRSVGQIPMYYAHGNTGKPPTPESIVSMAEIGTAAPQTSVGNTSFHLDVHPSPQYPFGYGLSYTSFEYADLRVEKEMRSTGDSLEIAFQVRNSGPRPATEVVQLYVRDLVASICRPVRELKAFERVPLDPGETRTVRFQLSVGDLSFFDGQKRVTEPGRFRLWVGGSSAAELSTETDVLRG